MSATLLAFVSVILVSAVSLVGLLTLGSSERTLRRLSRFFVSFAVGALLGDAFIHLVPESFSPRSGTPAMTTSLLILAGIVFFFGLEKLLRHRHGPLHRGEDSADPRPDPQLGTMNLAGDAIHNFVDGVLIGGSWLVSPAVGASTTAAVLLHEIPQELGDFGVLIHSGRSVRRAALLNVASAAVAILGTATAISAGALARQRVIELVVPVTAGAFVYIALADLVPELQHDRSVRSALVQTALVASGIGVMAMLAMIG